MRGKSVSRPQIRPFQSIHNDQRQGKDDRSDANERFKRLKKEARKSATHTWRQQRQQEEARQKQQIDYLDFLGGPEQNHDAVDMDHNVYVDNDTRLFTAKLFHRMAANEPLHVPSDVTIVVRGLEFPAHRLLLCAHSELWRTMLYPKKRAHAANGANGNGAAASVLFNGGVVPRPRPRARIINNPPPHHNNNGNGNGNGDGGGAGGGAFQDPPPTHVEFSLEGLACERDPTLRVWETVLRFCYTGELKVQQSNVHKVWEFCVHFKLKCLAEAVEEQLRLVLLDCSNIFPTIQLALRYRQQTDGKLAKHCRSYFDRNCREILNSKSFLTVAFDELTCALSNPQDFDFRIPEFELFEAIIRWYKHQVQRKRPPPKPRESKPARKHHARIPSRKLKNKRLSGRNPGRLPADLKKKRAPHRDAMHQSQKFRVAGPNAGYKINIHEKQPSSLVMSLHNDFKLVVPDDDDDFDESDESPDDEEFSANYSTDEDFDDPFASDHDVDESAPILSTDDDEDDPFAASGDEAAAQDDDEQEQLRSLVDHLQFHAMTADEIEAVLDVVRENPEYGLQYLVDDESLGRDPSLPQSALMTTCFSEAISKLLETDKCPSVEFQLLYSNAKHRRDDATISRFHERCDTKGATICLIRAKPANASVPKDEMKQDRPPSREIFGGYNPLDWCSSKGRRSSGRRGGAPSPPFLFSLVGRRSRGCDEPPNDTKLVPLKFTTVSDDDLDNGEQAADVVERAPNLGPSFGDGDLHISNERFGAEDSMSHLKYYRCERQQAELELQKEEALLRQIRADEAVQLRTSICSDNIFSIDILEVFSVKPRRTRSRSWNPLRRRTLPQDKPR